MHASCSRHGFVSGLAATAILMFIGCSWTHHVWVENASGGKATITYKLSCLGIHCFFPDSALVTLGNDVMVYHLDPADSTITFPLPAGAKAELGHTWNSTYRYIHEQGGVNSRVDNLEWIRIKTAKREQRLNATEFVAASDTRKSGRTMFRILP